MLTLSVDAVGLNCKAKVFEVLPALAVSVAVCAVLTEAIVAEKLVVSAPSATSTDDGTFTAASLLDRLTLAPPVVAAEFSVIEQEYVPDPTTQDVLQVKALSAGPFRIVLSAVAAVTIDDPPQPERARGIQAETNRNAKNRRLLMYQMPELLCA